MSRDKRKKHARAMDFLRWLNAERRGAHSGLMRIDRRLSPVATYCVERGLAKIRRQPFGKRLSFAILDSGLRDRS